MLDDPRALPQGDCSARPALAGGKVGRHGELMVFYSGEMLDDVFAIGIPAVDPEGEMRPGFHYSEVRTASPLLPSPGEVDAACAVLTFNVPPTQAPLTRGFLCAREWPVRGSQRPDCVAGHVGLELRNVVANYPFESLTDLQESSRILATESIRV